jgi:MFS family permease
MDVEQPPSMTQEIPSDLLRQISASGAGDGFIAVQLTGADDLEHYRRFSNRRKILITMVLAFCAMLSPISSTMVLSAIPEVAETYDVSADLISLSNAAYLACMAMSAFIWGPVSSACGRRWVCIASAVQFCIFNVATALAPTLAAFYVFRILTALQSTCLLIVGNSCVGDIYEPTARATAVGWFALATVVGPAFGPFVGGVIVTFRSWTVIFWVQAALGGLASVLLIAFLPETISEKRIDDDWLHHRGGPMSRKDRVFTVLSWISPWRVVVLLFTYPNLLITGIASSALIWNMYSVLTPIRYVLNPRFHLTSPMQSGLFYIAPGCGYLAGSPLGGWWADRTVKRWIRKRGRRIPEDRLRGCYAILGAVLPASVLLYGWSVQAQFGGIPVPVLALFAQGFTQWLCFPNLNTYALDVMQSRGLSAEVIAGNYLIRYVFAAVGSAVCLPAVRAMGVGWFSTVSSGFLVFGALGVWATTIYGAAWRTRADQRSSRRDTVACPRPA